MSWKKLVSVSPHNVTSALTAESILFSARRPDVRYLIEEDFASLK
jgi:hypothetical protein